MPQGLVYDAGLKNCATAFRLLLSLGGFNAWNAFLSIFFSTISFPPKMRSSWLSAFSLGHDTIRKKIPSCSCSKQWGPWSSMLMALIHPFAMLAATLSIRANGFYPNISLVFAIWTMRPRLVATPIWYLFANCCSSRPTNPYLWTFKDNVVEETLLNIFALPFAIWYIIGRQYVQPGECASVMEYQLFWNAFYVIAGAGIISLLLLTFMLFHWCFNAARHYTRVNNGKGGGERLSCFWKWTLTIGGLNMFVAFTGQWLLWSGIAPFYRLLNILCLADVIKLLYPMREPTSALVASLEKV